VKAFQLIYTKLPPGTSPWSKQDFHTVFYPLALMQRPQVTEMESHIHWPQERDIGCKETVFFQKLQGQEYLVVLRLHTLPADRDHLGRGGIFLG
jgi:hypothetical protein